MRQQLAAFTLFHTDTNICLVVFSPHLIQFNGLQSSFIGVCIYIYVCVLTENHRRFVSSVTCASCSDQFGLAACTVALCCVGCHGD